MTRKAYVAAGSGRCRKKRPAPSTLPLIVDWPKPPAPDGVSRHGQNPRQTDWRLPEKNERRPAPRPAQPQDRAEPPAAGANMLSLRASDPGGPVFMPTGPALDYPRPDAPFRKTAVQPTPQGGHSTRSAPKRRFLKASCRETEKATPQWWPLVFVGDARG